jgi:hypothetical protein
MPDADVSPLLQRIADLERSLRRWKRVALLSAAGAVLFAVAAAGSNGLLLLTYRASVQREQAMRLEAEAVRAGAEMQRRQAEQATQEQGR